MKMNHPLKCAALMAASITHASIAHADDPAPIAATTVIAAPTNPATANDETRLRLTLGGAFTAGNSQSATFSTAGRFTHRRGIHLFTLEHAINRGFTNVPTQSMMPTTTTYTPTNLPANYLLRGRYDVFFTDWLSGFAVVQAYRDWPQGFWSQVMAQIGPSFTLVNVPTRRRWWAEVAGSIAYENLTSPVNVPTLPPVYDHVIGLARIFTGYEERATPLFSFNVGLEALLNLTNGNDVRFNGIVGVTSRISSLFSLGFNLQAHYLTQPITDHFAYDVLGTVSLIVENGWTPHHPPPAPVPPSAALTMPVTEPISGERPLASAAPSSSSPPPSSASPSPPPAAH